VEASTTSRLPRGIFFETERQRWRVRLYKTGEVIHLSYHRSIEDAMEGWIVAKTRQQHAVRRHFTPRTHTISGLLQTLANSLHPQYTFA
jgi:hypothetical protein